MDDRHFLSLRYKFIAAFLGIGLLLSFILAVVSYHILERKLFSELRRNVGNVTHLGAELIDRDALSYLISKQQDELTAKQVDTYEKSKEYKRISDQLNFMRDTEKSLIRYVYLVTPTKDAGMARYLVDADVIEGKENGEKDEEISHFNSELDITKFQDMQQALREQKSLVEEQYVFDDTFKVNTVSGYAPIFDKDSKKFIALLGMDMTDKDVQAALKEVARKSIIVAAMSLLAALISAIVLGTWVTKGIVKLDNLVLSFAKKNFNVRVDLDSNDEVGRLGNSFNHMAETIETYSAQLEKLVDAYGRFVPHDLLRYLDKSSILDVRLGDQVQKEMSVLFSDIRDFTTISETMSPRENFNFINSYLSSVGPEIRANHGIIDKYIGDAVMALFEGPVEDAIHAALAMQNKVREYNNQQTNSNFPPIKIGVGIHTGKVMLGTVGEDQRMDGTVISDTVNLASRIEGLTKKYGCQIIISDTALESISNKEKYFTRLIDKVAVAGKTEAVELHEICDSEDDNILALKRSTLDNYKQAIHHYYSANFADAETLFEKVLSANNDDFPAQLYLRKTKSFIENGTPTGWDGVTRYDSKA